MPVKKGTTAVTVGLAEDLAQQLTHLAADPTYGSKANVIDTALRHLLAGSPEQSLLDGLHSAIATMHREMQKSLYQGQERQDHALQTVEHVLETLTDQVRALAAHVTALEQQHAAQHRTLVGVVEGFKREVTEAYDRMKARLSPPRRRWWG